MKVTQLEQGKRERENESGRLKKTRVRKLTDVSHTKKKRDRDVCYVNLYADFIDWMERQLSFLEQ